MENAHNSINSLNRRIYEIAYNKIDNHLLEIENEIQKLKVKYGDTGLKASDYSNIEKQILKLRRVHKETQSEFDKLDKKFEDYI